MDDMAREEGEGKEQEWKKGTELPSEFKKELLSFLDAIITDDNLKKINPENIKSFKKALDSKKRELAKKYSLKKVPTEIELLSSLNNEEFKKYKRLLTSKPVRSGSGVAVIAVMSKPGRCPHGKCTFCPGGLNSTYGDVPQSYTGHEPATMRGARADYDSYIQVFNRLEQYFITGHDPEKVELIIMGGTFQNFPKEYQDDFIKGVYKAMNDFSKLFYKEETFNFEKFKQFFELPAKLDDEERAARLKKKIIDEKMKGWDETSYKQEEDYNDLKSKIKCVGLTFETRPDVATVEEANRILDYGCTRVELGIQSVYDDALERVHRGHTVDDNIRAIYTLRNLGFKLNFHIMPGLPGVFKEEDIALFKELFSNPAYQPDMLKIYPCMVMPGTALYQDYIKGLFKPLSTEEAAEIIAEGKRYVKPYTRIMRVQRDIPTNVTIAGVNKTNLRQLISKKLVEKGISCQCIRCREAKSTSNDPSLIIREYDVLHGKEYFISFEDEKKNKILGFIRLSFPELSLRPEITTDSAFIRELHVYGRAEPIAQSPLINNPSSQVQHKGLGKRLLAKAEEIAKEHSKKKMIIISGVGVRGYYRRQGYRLEGPYMVKEL